jgi:hypothetical protein
MSGYDKKKQETKARKKENPPEFANQKPPEKKLRSDFA